jgi:transcriptional regulator with XRE-family HTH domain
MQAKINIAVSRNVRAARNRKGLSQEALADLCGLHRTYIGAVERAERNITLQTLAKLADALGETPQSLLDGGWS